MHRVYVKFPISESISHPASHTWVANRPGSLLVMPVGDVAQHAIANLCFFTQNGYCIYDDVKRQRIPGPDQFPDIVDAANPLPMTFPNQYPPTDATPRWLPATS